MKRWIEPHPITPAPDLTAAVGGHPLVAATLTRRGIVTPSLARAFLDPSAYTPTSPLELPDMDRAVERLQVAISAGERICIWGDFDVDGQTATALLYAALRARGANVTYHVPHRQREGHGITIPFLDAEIEAGARLLLTCDTGIAAHEAIDHANARGVDVIVTDHHNLTATLPNAHAAINPKRLPADHPLRELPGVGVAYKLIEALAGADQPELLDLVALGIVADVAVQSGDARYLLQRGLDRLRAADRLGLRALYERAGLDSTELSEEHIGFVIAPRLNALGRLDDAALGIELLTTDDSARAAVLAAQLESLNQQRKLLTDQIFQAAEAQIARDRALLDEPALVLGGVNWHSGVVGIVASRLIDLYNRPVVLLNLPAEIDGIARGSARSIDGIDISAALTACADLLIGYGGHTMAAGMALKANDLSRFRRALIRAVRAQAADLDTTPTLAISGYVNLPEITLDLVADLERLAPFGAGNPALTLAVRDVQVVSHSTVGRGAEHRTLTIADANGNRQRVIWWQGGDQTVPPGVIDLAFVARANDYKGERQVQIEFRDWRAAAGALSVVKPAIEVIDLRETPDLALVPDDTLIWREPADENSVDRRKLRLAEALTIYTAPPSPRVLRAALEIAQPARVYLLALDPQLDDFEKALQRLMGLLKYAVNQRGGVAAARDLAAALAHDEALIPLALEALQSAEVIAYEALEGGAFKIEFRRGGATINAHRLTAHLNETAAYRAYVRRADPARLIAL